MEETVKIKECFCKFITEVLEDNRPDASRFLSPDVMAVGMGSQGIIRCREDACNILLNTQKNGAEQTETRVEFSHMQVRYYGDPYASINAVLTIRTTIHEEVQTSRIGQCASLRKTGGEWRIIMMQATPLSIKLEELDAYPLAFAEEQIENYRAQEMLSKYKKQNMIACYKMDLTDNQIEDYKSYSEQEYSYPTAAELDYEKELFKSAGEMLEGSVRLKFVQTFSVANLMSAFRSGQEEVSMEYESTLPGGSKLWMSTKVFMFLGNNDHLKAYLYLLDIDKEKKRELELEYRAEMDLMTGLYNKSVMSQKIVSLIDTPLPFNQGTLMVVDIDCFKHINDTYGHAAGDEMIQKIAGVLKEIFSKESIIGRIGGDEFCVFYTENVSEDRLLQKLERISELVHAIELPDQECRLSVSVGVAKRGSESFEELFRKADKALYIRKREYHKDGYTFYKD